MVETIRRGRNKSYPPVNSAVRKIAINGACITPDITPAMPISAKFLIDKSNPKSLFNKKAKKNPDIHPTYNDGANVPPTPPPPFVADVANTFVRIIRPMKMKINDDLLRQMESDLSLNTIFSKGKNNPTRNCWHFCTDGNAVNSLFYDDEDFANGMNRAFVIAGKFRVVVLAFCLMDTHVHFILYGEFRECNGFLHKYLRLTSKYISAKHNEKGNTWH